jgi:hypothetical protein
MSNITVSTDGSPADSTVERVPACFVGMAPGLPGFAALWRSMAARRGIAVIGVDAAYTSKWGAQHWVKPLQQQTSAPVTRHHAAATAIGRRGLGLAIRRRPAGPRNGQRINGQRTATGTPPARLNHRPNHGGRQGSSGPPAHTRCAPVPRITPAGRGQHRSGRNQAGLTPAHSGGTVWSLAAALLCGARGDHPVRYREVLGGVDGSDPGAAARLPPRASTATLERRRALREFRRMR